MRTYSRASYREGPVCLQQRQQEQPQRVLPGSLAERQLIEDELAWHLDTPPMHAPHIEWSKVLYILQSASWSEVGAKKNFFDRFFH